MQRWNLFILKRPYVVALPYKLSSVLAQSGHDVKLAVNLAHINCLNKPISAAKASPQQLMRGLPTTAASSASCFATHHLPYMLPDLFNVILCHCCSLCSVIFGGSSCRCSPKLRLSMQMHGKGRRPCLEFTMYIWKGRGTQNRAISPNINV